MSELYKHINPPIYPNCPTGWHQIEFTPSLPLVITSNGYTKQLIITHVDFCFDDDNKSCLFNVNYGDTWHPGLPYIYDDAHDFEKIFSRAFFTILDHPLPILSQRLRTTESGMQGLFYVSLETTHEDHQPIVTKLIDLISPEDHDQLNYELSWKQVMNKVFNNSTPSSARQADAIGSLLIELVGMAQGEDELEAIQDYIDKTNRIGFLP